jgi:hypothetical protein
MKNDNEDPTVEERIEDLANRSVKYIRDRVAGLLHKFHQLEPKLPIPYVHVRDNGGGVEFDWVFDKDSISSKKGYISWIEDRGNDADPSEKPIWVSYIRFNDDDEKVRDSCGFYDEKETDCLEVASKFVIEMAYKYNLI